MLILTHGIPASGKSTWAKEEKRKLENRGRKVIVVSRDAIRYSFFGDYVIDFELEPMVTKISHATIEQGLADGFVVIVDDMNLRSQYVTPLIKMAVKHEVNVVSKSFTDVPLSVCKERNANRDRVVPEHVMENNHTKWVVNHPVDFNELIAKITTEAATPEYIGDDSLPTAYLVDLDGTIADNNHGRGYYEWDKVADDAPIPEVIEVVQAIHDSGHAIIVMSGRDSICMEDSKMWLDVHNVPYDAIFMRSQGDNRKDSIVKKELFDDNVRDHYNVLGVFDDRIQVVNMWRSIGLRVFQVDAGNY